MRNTFFSLLIFLLPATVHTALAQNCNGRYETEIFSGFTKTTVQYTDVYTVRPGDGDTLKMDIYQPDGDTFAKRPVIIMAHGGTFYQGDRTESTCTTMCELFAKRGYVSASIDYRLANSQPDLLDSLNALAIALKAVGDMKASVRYFKKDAATLNELRIDPNQIWVGGNSAGAITALHAAFVNDTAELPAHIKPIVAQGGGIDGNSGNPGYSSAVSGVINLAGGINILQWIGADDMPIVSCHGNSDPTVPYNCGNVLYSFLDNLVDLCGSGAIHSWCAQIGTEDTLLTFPGDLHVPWENNTSKRNLMTAFVLDFVSKHTICDSSAVGIRNNISVKNLVSVYPNPASDKVTIRIESQVGKEKVEVEIFDAVGKSVKQEIFSSKEIHLNISDLEKGVYLLQIKTGGQSSTTLLHKL
ncbi:MAG: T9SS type A sorting domain-containing protein [Chitinophagales bacterium]|nr:T9SS type A sorting domain-containing protein [Chitinophagales bacterium]